MSTYTQHYSNFIGVDMSSDPRSVARNRLAYAENMWRDYESEQGSAIETFPGFRRLVRDLGAVHGLFGYRAKSGEEYLIVHAGTNLYSFESEYIAALDDSASGAYSHLLKGVTLADSDSTSFIFNNNLYVLDGSHFVVVSSVTDQNGAVSVTANEVNAYVPTTYFDGKPIEQRNMLVDEAWEKTTAEKTEKMYSGKRWYEFVRLHSTYDNGYHSYENVIGFVSGYKTPYIYVQSDRTDAMRPPLRFQHNAFQDELVVQEVVAHTAGKGVVFQSSCFQGCKNLNKITLYINSAGSYADLTVCQFAFADCPNLKELNIYLIGGGYVKIGCFETDSVQNGDLEEGISNGEWSIPKGVDIKIENSILNTTELNSMYLKIDRNRVIPTYESATRVKEVKRIFDNKSVEFGYAYDRHKENGKVYEIVEKVYVKQTDLEYYPEGSDENAEPLLSDVEVLYELDPLRFSTIENVKSFKESNPDYEGTGVAAINGCTKCAVFDGRIFLTGNPTLPNTVFYSHRNLTGANDPTYFGAYNYFNDGDGNTPNVDLLSTPSMLMVLKNNTVQDGSIYYHTPAFNEDKDSGDLVPRIYPSTSGAAGLGCAGKTVPGTVACNFLDDPVFLSTRGLEAVGKQTVNLERTVTHRSSNVDRLLIKEDLSKASLAEWKGYLVICCEGNFYLADSRVVSQHQDGSYQYEWFYLKGLGCYKNYSGGFEYLCEWPTVDDEGNSLADCTMNGGERIRDICSILETAGEFTGTDANVYCVTAYRPDGSQFYFYYSDFHDALAPIDEEKQGVGEFYPARKIAVVGERLFFGTADGDVCVINTDKRGVPDYEEQNFESNRISSRWYSFAGVRYPSVCVTRLDDCSKKSLAKGTVPGTTSARFKMMPGSHLRANVSLNGRDFKKIGEAHASRYDAGDLRFDNFSFTENEDAVVVLRELTRNWVDKQYSFVSDGFREPFGLYEISYLYTVNGKIRRPFALIERE